MRKILLFVFLTAFSLCALAQENGHWKNLKLDVSSPQNAADILGKPKKDKIENAKIDKSIPANLTSQFNFRKLQFENIDNYKDVYLLFLNEKLFGIELVPKKKTIPASELSKIYDSDFLLMEGIPKQLKFSDFEGQKETTVPKVYPVSYFMLSVKPDSVILAAINNNTWKAIWRDGMKKPTMEMFPGYVESIRILSRSNEEK